MMVAYDGTCQSGIDGRQCTTVKLAQIDESEYIFLYSCPKIVVYIAFCLCKVSVCLADVLFLTAFVITLV